MPSGTTSNHFSTDQHTMSLKYRWTPFNTRIQPQQHLTPDTSTAPPSIKPEVSPVQNPTPKSLTVDRVEALLQM